MLGFCRFVPGNSPGLGIGHRDCFVFLFSVFQVSSGPTPKFSGQKKAFSPLGSWRSVGPSGPVPWVAKPSRGKLQVYETDKDNKCRQQTRDFAHVNSAERKPLPKTPVSAGGVGFREGEVPGRRRGNAPRAPIERGAAPLLPVWVVNFPKTTTRRRPPEVGCDIRRLSCRSVSYGRKRRFDYA